METIIALAGNEKIVRMLESLKSRWGEESAYEDFADYEKVMKNKLADFAVTFVKGIKKPFGFIVTDDATGKTAKVWIVFKGDNMFMKVQEV